MSQEPVATEYTPGERVLWADKPANLIARVVDDFDGGFETCGMEGCNRPLWRLRFDDGREKKYACEGSIERRLSDAE